MDILIENGLDMSDFETAKTLFFQGLDQFQAGHYPQAEVSFRGALAIIPERVSTLVNLSATLIKLRKIEPARLLLSQALSLDDQAADAWLNMGLVNQASDRPLQALECFDQALRLDPNYLEGWCNKGVVLSDLQRHDEALACHDYCLRLSPDHVQALTNKGVTLTELKRYDQAMACYDQALRAVPAQPEANWNQALIRLAHQDFEAGWKQYEYRWQRVDHDPTLHGDIPTLPTLQASAGRRVLIWAEQGLGDTIQFSRYIPMLTRMGAQVVFEVPMTLKGLLATMPDCGKVIAHDEAAGAVDFQLPLLSLPRLFHTTAASIPASVPYLSARAERVDFWKVKLGLVTGRPKIGVACYGNARHRNDQKRSMALQYLAPLCALGDVFLIQKDFRPEDRDWLAKMPAIRFLGDQIRDFDDTAAIVQNMDVVISVDTSLAHLAGAMGQPLLVLVPWVPEWRWLLEGDQSAWYPTARIVRQPSMGDWDAVMQQVVDDLAGRF